jgi:glycosyltransferase involved in cell wall biosynthesis
MIGIDHAMNYSPEQGRRMKIYIVIPLYNEEKYIGEVLSDLKKYKLPIIVVDDGSLDKSRLKVKELQNKQVTLLEHKINLGKGAAMKTGADYAFLHGAEAAIFMDSDNQHEAADITKFINALESKKYEVVFGTRNYNYTVPLIRYLGNKFASILLEVMFKIFVTDVLCGFKGMTKKAYEKLKWNSSGYGVETEIVARAGKVKLSFLEVPIQTIYHDKDKGVTILDALGILGQVMVWKFTI